MDELQELLREQRVVVAALKATATRMKATSRETSVQKLPTQQRILLLHMAEGLNAAHRAAKIDDDGMALDLIEDAMRYIGGRLAKESGDGRNFSYKRLGPL